MIDAEYLQLTESLRWALTTINRQRQGQRAHPNTLSEIAAWSRLYEAEAAIRAFEEDMRRGGCQRCGLSTGFKTFGLCDACVVECQDSAAARGADWP